MATETSVMAVIRASRPSFKNPHDKIAFAVHASFLSAGFSLVATGRNAFSDNLPTDGDEVGIEGWNELEDSYGFVYTKTEKESKKTVLMKCLPIGDVLMIDVLNLNEEQKEPINLQINIKDHLTDGVGGTGNYGEMYKNFQGLVEKLNTGVLAKLEPKAERTSSVRSGAEISECSTTNEPAVVLHVERQPLPSGLVYPPVPSFGGNSDLYPGPGAGFYSNRGSGFDGDMLVGPNDPRWFGSGEHPGFAGGIPGVPPGARFDPYGPPDVPGFEPSRFVRHPRRPGGGTHPDLEHFQGPDFI